MVQWWTAGQQVEWSFLNQGHDSTKFISLAQVVAGLVQHYSAESRPKTPITSFHTGFSDWLYAYFSLFIYIYNAWCGTIWMYISAKKVDKVKSVPDCWWTDLRTTVWWTQFYFTYTLQRTAMAFSPTYLQCRHMNGRMSVCVWMCLRSMLGFLQRMPHSSHTYRPRPLPLTYT